MTEDKLKSMIEKYNNALGELSYNAPNLRIEQDINNIARNDWTTDIGRELMSATLNEVKDINELLDEVYQDLSIIKNATVSMSVTIETDERYTV